MSRELIVVSDVAVNERGVDGRGHDRIAAAHRFPDDVVQQDVIARIFFGEIEFEIGAVCAGDVFLIYVDLWLDDLVGAQIWFASKGVIHGSRGGIELAHGLHAEDEFHRAQHAAGGVHRGISFAEARVWAYDVSGGAMSVDVVGAALRVIFDNEYCGLRPERRFADGLNDLTDAVIILRDESLR